MPFRRFLRPVKRVVHRALTRLRGDDQQRVVVRTLTGPSRGLRFRLDLLSGLEDGYFYGYYDRGILKRLAALIRPGWVVWECGVYIGYYTNFFARCTGSGGRVIAFEPNPSNRERADQNVRLNRFDHVSILPYAIGGPLGKVPFIVNHNTNSHIPGCWLGATPEEYHRIERQDAVLEVECLSLDQLVEKGDLPAPDLVKIDIEGAELHALEHMHRLASAVGPLIVLELHNPECDRAAWRFAQTAGYTLESLDRQTILTREEDVRGTLLCYPTDRGRREARTCAASPESFTPTRK
jgi:FkbM family methyltransferase